MAKIFGEKSSEKIASFFLLNPRRKKRRRKKLKKQGLVASVLVEIIAVEKKPVPLNAKKPTCMHFGSAPLLPACKCYVIYILTAFCCRY